MGGELLHFTQIIPLGKQDHVLGRQDHIYYHGCTELRTIELTNKTSFYEIILFENISIHIFSFVLASLVPVCASQALNSLRLLFYFCLPSLSRTKGSRSQDDL